MCAAARDDEVRDRVRAIQDTTAAVRRDDPATGWPTLARLLGANGETVVRTAREWLGVGRAGAAYRRGDGPRPRRYAPLPEWVPFPTDVLPDPWRSFVRQGAASVGCDEALLALPVLSVLAATVGNARRLHVGRNWFEPAVVWAVVVGESGGLKSPAFALVVDLLHARQKALLAEHKQAVKAYAREKAEFKKAERAARGEGTEVPGDEPEPPVLRRLVCADTTIERLAGILQENPRGVLVARDELAGWLQSFTRYKGKGGGSDLPNWLEMHRAGTVVVDRKTGDVKLVYVPHAAVSVCGGIQPGVLAGLLNRDFFDSGLTARLLSAMPPRRAKVWVDAEADPPVLGAVGRNLDALLGLAFDTDADGDPVPVVLRFSPEGKA